MTESLTEFETTADAFVRAGSLYCDAPAEAIYPGNSGNAGANEVNIMQGAPMGVSSVTNPLPFSGGEDEESDADLRERIVKSYRSIPNGGNIAYYEMLALNVSGVAAVKVLPRERGRGTVDIIIASDNGVPTQELLSAVSDAVDSRREICVDVDVNAPVTTAVDITAAITVAPEYTASTVIEKVRTAITDYFGGKRLGKKVLRAELGKIIYSVEGVENYRLTAPSADVQISESGMPVLRNLNVSEA